MFTLPPSEQPSQARPCSVPCWDLLQTNVHGKVEFPLPLKHMLFSLFPTPEVGAWSLPAPVRPDFLRQSVSVPGEADSWGGPSSRWVKGNMCGLLAATVDLEQVAEPQLAQEIRRGGTVTGHSLLNSGDEAQGEMPSIFPLSASIFVQCS